MSGGVTWTQIVTSQPTMEPTMQPTQGGMVPLPVAEDHLVSISAENILCSSSMSSFSYTGASKQYQVPEGFNSVLIGAMGAAGGGGFNSGWYGEGGSGGHVKALHGVNRQQLLYINVGGRPSSRNSDYTIDSDSGGYNGGGSACGPNSGPGGGASDVRVGSDDLDSRILVAGGGGGASSWSPGGNGGGDIGGSNCGLNGGSQTQGGNHSTCHGALGYGGGYGMPGCPIKIPDTTCPDIGICAKCEGIYNLAGGGGGYYGGGAGLDQSECFSGGGSSFSSGLIMANAKGVNGGQGAVSITPCYVQCQAPKIYSSRLQMCTLAIAEEPNAQPTRRPTQPPTAHTATLTAVPTMAPSIVSINIVDNKQITIYKLVASPLGIAGVVIIIVLLMAVVCLGIAYVRLLGSKNEVFVQQYYFNENNDGAAVITCEQPANLDDPLSKRVSDAVHISQAKEIVPGTIENFQVAYL